MVVTAINATKYGKLLAETLPLVIETRQEFNRLVQVMEGLDHKDSLTPEELTLRKLLERLIQQFDDRIELPDEPPYKIVLHLMEHRGLRQADLLPIFGSRSVASAVLNGKRAISKNHARKLAQFFNLGVELFI